jgi:formamidopyrimidine-DNA glycosylase
VTNPQKWCTPARARSRYTCDLEKANGRDAGSVSERLQSQRRTLKRALTDPRIFSGIGNAYSDEILHAARLSPLQLTTTSTKARSEICIGACVRSRAIGQISCRGKRTARSRFTDREIVYANNECNYCATCQTGGKLLADRALSRLLGEDWP